MLLLQQQALIVWCIRHSLEDVYQQTGTKAVTVNQTPVISFLDSLNPTNCGSATGYIRLSGLLNNTSYTVNYLKGATPVSGKCYIEW